MQVSTAAPRLLTSLCALLLGSACSLLVDPGSLPEKRCTPEPGGEVCGGGDEDCDGLIDEGHDADLDGFTWCGGGGADRPLMDCDDTDPEVHPANPAEGVLSAAERCDGKDNDCNGVVDDAPPPPATLCPAGLICVDRNCIDAQDCSKASVACSPGTRCDVSLTPPRCVDEPGCAPGTPGTCPDDQICDADSGTCITVVGLGEACAVHAQCGSGSCVDREALGLTTGAARVCSKSCCSDDDCTDGSICWASGTGARLCAPGSLLGLTRGSGGPGMSCSAGSDCESGLCDPEDACVANCAIDGDCGSLACGLSEPFDRGSQIDFVQLACTEAVGLGAAGDSCLDHSDCSVGTCWFVFFPFFCSGTCRTQSDCNVADAYCGYTWREAFGGRRDWFQACTPKVHAGLGRSGDSCTDDENCFDRACVQGTCAPTCCTDSSCGDGRRCRPIRAGSRYEMHCVL